MILKQHRIHSLKCLDTLKNDAKLVLVVEDLFRFPKELKKFGFDINDTSGTKLLPSVFNKYTKQNAEQYTTIDKTLPKEKYYQTVYWTRTEWAGRGETREVTEFTDILRERYHRNLHPPYSVEFTLIEKDNKRFIQSDIMQLCEENKDKIKNTINMLLGIFGECQIVSNDFNTPAKVVRLNWDILPPGKYPWNDVKSTIEAVASKSNNTQKHMMLRNCELINNYLPDFIAYGKAGFRGYVIFGFTKQNLYILESVIPNNATYVFESNWETISQLSKAEILNQNLHKDRIIHNSNWGRDFINLMEDINE